MKKHLIILSALTISFLAQCQQRTVTGGEIIKNAPAQHPFRLIYENDPRFREAANRMTITFTERTTPPAGGISKTLYDNIKAIGLKFYDYAKANGPAILENVLNSPMAQQAKEKAITAAKYAGKSAYEFAFVSKEDADKDAYQTEWVKQAYANQQEAAKAGDQEALTRATQKLRDFFYSEQGQQYSLRHLEE